MRVTRIRPKEYAGILAFGKGSGKSEDEEKGFEKA
jgi:hypothetical protein